MPSTNFQIESFEHKGKFYNIDVDCEYHWDNDGIGSYEYWGAKGFDKGHDYAEADDICITAYLIKSKTEVEVKDNDTLKALQSAIEEEVMKHLEKMEPDDSGYED